MESKDILVKHSERSQKREENCTIAKYANVDNDKDSDSAKPFVINSLEKVDYYRINNFSVGDILKSKKQGGYFVTNNNHFLHVQICGTIISKTHNSKRMHIEVHDGSGCITCFLEDDYFKNNTDRNMLLFREKETKTDNIFQATAMTFSSLQYLSSIYLPKNPDSVKQGEIVLLEGKLSEHNGKFFVFITKLNKKTMADFIDTLEYRKLFYENHLIT